jgi:DNA-binding LacI/PurR family transcriptional regulator
MCSSPGTFELPQRASLSAQVAATLRSAIDGGTWQSYLPGERRLCQLFQVSRPTIQTALRALAKEGRLEIRRGCQTRIRAASPKTRAGENRLVGLVTPEPVLQMTQNAHHGISEMRAHLAEHGFRTEIFVCGHGGPRAQIKKLEAFLAQNAVFCCVLISVSKDVQTWFAQHSIPALVLGWCHAGVKLPSLDVDFRSVCRHAAGIFLRRGHRHMALVVQNSGAAGELASAEGFQEGAARNESARPKIVRHNGTARNITDKLDALFRSPHPPTALLVAKPLPVFAVLFYLLRRNLAIPESVSVIARDQDYLFGSFLPAIAHYRFDGNSFVQRLTHVMLKLVGQGFLSPEPQLLFPKFCEGDTVAAVREQP